MKEFRRAIVYWKMSIIKCTGKALFAVVNSIVATLNGVQWSDFTPTQKFVAIACGIAAGWTVVDAFLSDSMANLRQSKTLDETLTYQAPSGKETPTP